MDKSIWKTSFNLFGKYILCLTMAFIICASLFMVFSATSADGQKVEGAAYVVMMVIAEICSLGTIILFMNGTVYYIADSDANKVKFGRIEPDKFKGLKLSVVPTAFALCTYIALILGKIGILGDGALVFFRTTNYHLYAYNQILFGGKTALAEVGWGSVAAAVLTVVIVPVICHISYTLGFKGINVAEKLIFKKESK